MSVPARRVSKTELAAHAAADDAWVAIDGVVYDVSKFAKLHPGGRQVLLRNSGKDASADFHLFHSDAVLRKYGPRLQKVGTLDDSRRQRKKGQLVLYSEPIWTQRFNSPYYKDTHRKWRAHVRSFTEREIISTMHLWAHDAKPPRDLMLKMGAAGLLAGMCGPTPYFKSDALPSDYDYFHELILYDELSRCGSSAVVAALTNGPAIGLSVILRFGTEEQKTTVIPAVLSGEKFIALAISEPNAGSDVAGMQCTARRDGDHFVVNGNKKWITNGTYADYFATAVVTGKQGHSGISFLLVERGTPGFKTRKLNVRDSTVSGTAYLDFDECRIPAKNLIGQENAGWKHAMHNFNHERWYIATVCTRLARICLEECVKYATKRKTFGKYLHQHQAIRMKIAAMTRQVESMQAWLELVTYQMCTMDHREANEKIGDVVGLLKVQASKVYEFCARETTQVFGGNALLVNGVGQKIEPAVMQVKGYQIPAGAEDVMDDFGARTTFKVAMRSKL